MAFKNPVGNQSQPSVSPELMSAVAHVLSHNHIGQWGSDHIQESRSYQGWTYLAIAAIGRQAARAHVYVYRDTLGIKSQDQSAALSGTESLTAKLVMKPNHAQSGALFQWEYIQQMHLHGCCLIFNRPSLDGSRTAARYIIPMALTQPIYPGQDIKCPQGGVRVLPYQAGLGWYVNTLVSALSGATIPIENVSIIRYPHPVLRGDGQSPTDASGWWADTSMMIDMARWKHLRRGPRPYGIISVDSDEEITDDDLDAIEKRLNKKLNDNEYDERAVALGKKVSIQSDTTPVDMDYIGAFEQMGESILAIHGIGKAFVGLQDNMTFGSNAAAMQMGLVVVQSDLDLLAGEWSQLAQDEGEQVTVQYEVQPMDDPTLIETQLAADVGAGVLTVKEYRAKRNLKPFGDWRDDCRVTPQGFVDDKQKPEAKPAAQSTQFGQPEAIAQSWVRELKVEAKAKSLLNDQRRYALPDAPVVAFDLDATLAQYSGVWSEDYIGDPIQSGVEAAKQCKAAGCQIVIFTCRDNDELVSQWLDAAGVPWDAINANPNGAVSSGKVFADVYFDDKAVNVSDGIEGIARQLPECEAKRRLLRKPAEAKLGCVMLEAPARVKAMVQNIQSQIPPIQLVGDGYEDWPHVTLLYGIVGTPIEDVVAFVRKIGQVDATFGKLSLFDNADGSVLKVEVDSPVLHKLNGRIKESFPVEETYPDYRPHMTVAYMDREAAPSYTGSSPLSGHAVTFTHAVVSMGGQKIRVPLSAPVEQPTLEAVAAPLAMSKSIVFEDAGESIKISTLAEMESKFKQFDQSLTEFHRRTEESIAERLDGLAKAFTLAKADSDLVANPPTPEVHSDPDPGPTAAGLLVYAADTGRVLMLQRAISEDDPASGTWEAPGGGANPEEEPLETAKREWMEETGHIIPKGELVGQWDYGIYRGHVWQIPNESRIRINMDHEDRHVMNVDDPDGDAIEVVAWWEPSQLKDNPAVRQELSESIDMVLAAIPKPVKPETNWDERLANLLERRDPDGLESTSENIPQNPS
jgi:8-oxo-dGTP pyrophosphatase MutT (NUDIX family)